MNPRLKARTWAQSRAGKADWYRIANQADADSTDVWVYGEIGWDVMSSEFVRDIQAISTGQMHLHMNTVGGDVFDGIAIYNALRDHPAAVTVTVDALAASIGSVIAMAGDTIRMNRASQMMIHNPWSFCMGDSDDMRERANLLDRMADTLAGIYAARAGGDLATWRAAMNAETWYSSNEAVAAGLADEVVAEPADEAEAAAASWDLSIFTYAGRGQAPPPLATPAPPEPEPAPVAAAYMFPPDLFRQAIKAAKEAPR